MTTGSSVQSGSCFSSALVTTVSWRLLVLGWQVRMTNELFLSLVIKLVLWGWGVGGMQCTGYMQQ